MRAVVFAQGFAVALLGSTAGAEQVGVTAVGLQGIYDLGAGSVDEVASWLDGISFGELKKSFAKHQVDGPALRDITEDELRELGVKKVGARKLFGRLLCEALPDCDRPDLTAPEDEVNVSGFSVAEVGDWLVQEGFGDAKKAFAVQGVDGHALLDLNEDELKNELGVNRLGPRRRFARTLCTVMPGCKNPRRADDVASWSTGEVYEWLEQIGMGKYVKAFTKHEVDGLTLPDITEEELKTELNVVEIGLRKRFRTRLCALDRAFCQQQREDSGVDALGLGGIDLAQYVQKAQAYLSARVAEKGEAEGAMDLSALMQEALSREAEATPAE